MSHWRRFPNYKDSGVEWLGKVPEHWKTLALKRIVKIKITDGPHDTPDLFDAGIPFISAESIKNNKIDFSLKRGFISRDLHEKYKLKVKPQKNDIFIVKSGATTGAVAKVEVDFEFSIWSPLALIRVNDNIADFDFLFNFLQSEVFKKQIEIFWSFGTQQNIGMNVIERLYCNIPPLNEQSFIASYLEHETARIDALITKKERQIELLHEKRTALISNAVTKGLNPNVTYKLSGVEWIEHIPEHWQNTKLSSVTTKIGDGLHGTPEYTEESPHHFINGNNLLNGSIKITESARCVSSNEFEKYKIMLNDSTLLMSINGTIGSVAYYRGESIILGKSAAYINCGKSISRNYLFFLLQSTPLESYFRNHATGTTIFNLSLESLRKLQVILPPLTEQQEISSFLEYESTWINTIIEKIQISIDILHKYRTALISAAVTGKIDVRGEMQA